MKATSLDCGQVGASDRPGQVPRAGQVSVQVHAVVEDLAVLDPAAQNPHCAPAVTLTPDQGVAMLVAGGELAAVKVVGGSATRWCEGHGIVLQRGPDIFRASLPGSGVRHECRSVIGLH